MKYLTTTEVVGIPAVDMPLLVLSDNVRSWISWRIKWHTSRNRSPGYYNHAMWMFERGMVATQGVLYHKESIDRYLGGKYRLKFWRGKHWTNTDCWIIIDAIKYKLALPKRKRLYDPVGVLGQRLRLRWLNIPSLDYCSESAAEFLRMAEPRMVVKHPSPADLNRWCKESTHMEVYAVYDPDLT